MELKRNGEITIGLVADTHEAEDPVEVIERLGKELCDLYVHLGDIGGSRLTSKLAHEYKDTLGNMDHLSRRDKERYRALREQGLSGIMAFIELRMGGNPMAHYQRLAETAASYDLVLESMRWLEPVYFLSGNIDRALAYADHVRPSFERNGVSLIQVPEFIDLGEQAVVLWPSMKPATSRAVGALEAVVDQFVRRASSKKRVVVLAHEQLFKGPIPEKYRDNAARAGYKPLTVPYFEPNPTWRQMLRLFRSLPASTDLAFVHGHVHDPCHVIQAGAPYLKGSTESGLGYRLFGLAAATDCEAQRSGRRSLRIFCVPAGEAVVLTLGDQSVAMQTVKGSGVG